MALSGPNALDALRSITEGPRQAEATRLNLIAEALKPNPVFSVSVPRGAQQEMRDFAAKARTNYLPLILDVMSQGLFVEGYRSAQAAEDDAAWLIWQANGLDARQTGVHRSALAYGAAYMTVLPGEPHPVMRGVSPRKMTAVYQDPDEDDWPMLALREDDKTARLYDETSVYYFGREGAVAGGSWKYLEARSHGVGVCPVVRFRDRMLLDDETMGLIEPLIPIQSRIDETVFGLLTAQYFSAFRQRYAIGWEPVDSEGKPVDPFKAAVSHLWTFSDPDVKVGEFGQTDLGGYIKSKESAVQDMAAISQTPPQALLGEMSNLSAEALAATEAGKDRKTAEIDTSLGESHEQALRLASAIAGNDSEDNVSAQVRWRDSTARSLAQTVDALGKMVQMLGIPPEAVWERVPGTTKEDIAHWTALAQQSDSLGALTALLDAQSVDGQ